MKIKNGRGYDYIIDKYKLETDEEIKMFNDNVKLVYLIVNNKLKKDVNLQLLDMMDREDIMQDCMIELIKTIKNYDVEKGCLGTVLDRYIHNYIYGKLNIYSKKIMPLNSTETCLGTTDDSEGITIGSLIKDEESEDRQGVIEITLSIKHAISKLRMQKNSRFTRDDLLKIFMAHCMYEKGVREIAAHYGVTGAYICSTINKIKKIYIEEAA